MSESSYAVGIVVDPAFGGRLGVLAERMPVWLAATPANQAAAKAHWRSHSPGSRGSGVTTFRVDDREGPKEWLAGILATVIEHHGEHSHTPPVNVLLILGVEPEPDLRKELASHGFHRVTTIPEGFEARVA